MVIIIINKLQKWKAVGLSYDEYYWVMLKYPGLVFVIKFKVGKKISSPQLEFIFQFKITGNSNFTVVFL